MALGPDCVLLAAGGSTRMGRWKMLLPVEGQPMVARCAGTALRVCGRLIVVAGFRAQELEELFRGWKRVEVTVNDGYREGMLSSVRCGFRLVRGERFFLALGDMPLVAAATYRQLLAFPAAEAVIPKYHGKKGHPLLLGRSVGERVLGAAAACTLREVLAQVPTLSVPVEDPFILQDVDTPVDYRSATDPPS
jgi:molybdenum cofactor cytidylyltransferase